MESVQHENSSKWKQCKNEKVQHEMNVNEESETRIEWNTKQVQHEKMQYEENMES